MREVISELERLRRRTRFLLLAQRSAVLVGTTLASILALVLIDFALRLPSAIRLALLIGGLALLATALWRYLLRAFAYRPDLTQLALRVERALPALRGRLASSVEFAIAGVDQVNPLAGRTVRETQHRLSGASMRQVVRYSGTVRSLGLLAGALVLTAGLAAASPESARTGLSRLFAPYGSTVWPARTAVASLMDEVLRYEGVHPRGVVLPLRAHNLTDGGADERVDAHYRLREDGAWGDWKSVVLTHQGDGRHERLIDSGAEEIELSFATEDATTERERILLVLPPAVRRAILTVEPPSYAMGRVEPFSADLGPGLDDRSVAEEPALAGSRALLEIELNKPLPVPVDAGERETWIRETFAWRDGDAPELEVDPEDASRWRLSWVLDESRDLGLTLVDEHGLANLEPIRYRVEVSKDAAPSVTVTDPEADEVVLAGAIVPLAAAAEDDVAVRRVALAAEAVRARAAAGSATEDGAAPEPLDFAPSRDVDARTASIEAQLDLAKFALVEGDIVVVRGLAEDVFDVGGSTREAVRSAPRRLRVISPIDFTAGIRRQLSAVRQNAIRVDAIQSEIQDDLTERGPQPGLERSQAELAERIADQRGAVAELEGDLERNRLDDEALLELLRQARDALEYAGRAAGTAAAAIEAAQQSAPSAPGSPGTPGSPGAAEAERRLSEARDAQQEVRDELADLIELLDRDEDTWLVERQLEKLIETQAALEGETGELADATVGKSRDELSEMERTELDRIAAAQGVLPEETRRAVEEMRRRAQAIEEIDPQAASGMRTAADTAERMEVDRHMDQAASEASQARLQQARGEQQAALRTLERMLEDLEETRRARAEELLRQLASLLESIDRLISVQELELIALERAEAQGDFGERDRGMIRLRQNTQSVASEARSAGQDARRVARALDRAADAQGAAVAALRAEPIGVDVAREAENRSLALLREARAVADEVREQTEEDMVAQKREELIARYRELVQMQVALRAEALGLQGPLGRRQLVEARRLGNIQQEIRNGAGELEAGTRELVESEVFSYVHRLIDEWSASVSDALWDGKVDIDVTDRQASIAESLERQAAALDELSAPPDEFAEEGQGEGAGGGAPPGGQGAEALIPPVTELRRMHGLQEQLYEQTRGIDTRTDLADAQRRQRLRELGKLQRDLAGMGERLAERLGGPAVAPGAPEGAPDVAPDEVAPDDVAPDVAPDGEGTEMNDEAGAER